MPLLRRGEMPSGCMEALEEDCARYWKVGSQLGECGYSPSAPATPGLYNMHCPATAPYTTLSTAQHAWRQAMAREDARGLFATPVVDLLE